MLALINASRHSTVLAVPILTEVRNGGLRAATLLSIVFRVFLLQRHVLHQSRRACRNHRRSRSRSRMHGAMASVRVALVTVAMVIITERVVM